MHRKVILVTAASRKLGCATVKALAHSGHMIFAAFDDASLDARKISELAEYGNENGLDIRAVILDTDNSEAIELTIAQILRDAGRLDGIVHAEHQSALGQAEAFSDTEFARMFDRIVLSAQRVNRIAIPHLRHRMEGIIVWIVGSTTAAGGLPYRAPYLAAMSGLDALARQYAHELTAWNIETTIIVAGPQLYVGGGPDIVSPADVVRMIEADPDRNTAGLVQVWNTTVDLLGDRTDLGPIAGAVVEAVDTPFGYRPLRLHVDPSRDGADLAYAIEDRLRTEIYYRAGLGGLVQAFEQRRDILDPAVRRST